MYAVTDGYKAAVIATSRETKGKVEFEIVDVTAAADAVATVTSEEDFSKKAQSYNGVRETSAKYATSEDDYLLLDGSFCLPPKASESGFEVGWWSKGDALSGGGGTFAVSQLHTSDFDADHSSIGITITFDSLTDEYAKDFTVVYKDSGGSTLHTETVTNNTLAKYVLTQSVINFRKVIITVTKWKTANRRARIIEVDFGIIQEYLDADIIRLDVLEEVDTLSNQVTSNEMKLTLDNSSKLFNILNPAGIYPYLQRKQKLKPAYGTVITDTLTEFVPMGVFYLTEWTSDEGTLTVTFTARDIVDILNQDTFPETAYVAKTLTFILEDILDNAGVTDYVIDSALDAITVTGTLPESTRRDAIQTAALAGQAVVYPDRSGVLQIQQLDTTASVATIDYANVYSAPLIKLDKLINTVNVKYGASTYTLVDPAKPTSEQTLALTIDNPLIDTLALATSVAAWVLTEYQKRFLYEINWRQNPSLEITDITTIQDDFTANKTARLTKHEFSYDGSLYGKTYAKGDGT